MKKLIATFSILFVAVLGIVAQQASGPEITFESKVIDYGTIEQHSNGVREFHFTNTGSAPLIIQHAKGSCGCTVPSYDKEPVMPGESGTIKVKYATNRLGVFQKTVTLTTNATTPTVVLTIKGNVLAKPAAEGTESDAASH